MPVEFLMGLHQQFPDSENRLTKNRVVIASKADISAGASDKKFVFRTAQPAPPKQQSMLEFLQSQFRQLSTEPQPASPVYEVIVDTAARHMFDPNSLGDIKALKRKFNGQIHSSEDAIKCANEAFKAAGDPFTTAQGKGQVYRPKTGQSNNVVIAPQEAQTTMPSVVDGALADGLAYIGLRNFDDADAEIQMKDALERHSAARGYVIDLRGNFGGRIEKALLISSLFVESGKLLTLRERTDSDPKKPKYVTIEFGLSKQNIEAKGGDDKKRIGAETVKRLKDTVNKPVVLLVDSMTASAAEIFASALREHGDAVLIGTRTYGKGIAQKVFDRLPGGASLQVTSARYYTPKGIWFGDGFKHRIGITPDVHVQNGVNVAYCSEADEQLNTAVHLLSTNKLSFKKPRCLM